MAHRDRGTAALLLVWLACLAGTVHAGFSLYWALGGQWLLATVGQWAVELSAEGRLELRLAMVAVAAAKLAGATVPVAVAYERLPWRRLWRAVSWIGGAGLAVYGGLNTAIGAAVLSGLVSPEGGYDREAMIGHALLWDPLFLIWGATLLTSLWLSRGISAGPATHTAAGGQRDDADRLRADANAATVSGPGDNHRE